MLAPVEVVLQTRLLQDCLMSPKPPYFLADVMGTGSEQEHWHIPPVLSRSWLGVPGLWAWPYPTASREWGSEGTQGPHCTKQDF